MSYTSDIWLYPLQDWWKMVDEMSNFMSIGQMGNFIFRPVRKHTACNRMKNSCKSIFAPVLYYAEDGYNSERLWVKPKSLANPCTHPDNCYSIFPSCVAVYNWLALPCGVSVEASFPSVLNGTVNRSASSIRVLVCVCVCVCVCDRMGACERMWECAYTVRAQCLKLV